MPSASQFFIRFWVRLFDAQLALSRTCLLCILSFFVAFTQTANAGQADQSRQDIDYSKAFSTRASVAHVQSSDLDELSGLAASKNHPGMLWAHNDSGDAARVFLLNPKSGEVLLEVHLKGIDAYDAEDITMLELNGVPHIVLADIGDNRARRDYVSLYAFEEPSLEQNQTLPSILSVDSNNVKTMRLRYREGARDAEILMTQPDDTLILITKREQSNYVYQFDFAAGAALELEALTRLDIQDLTAGDIFADGAIALRSYAQIYFWRADPKDPLKAWKHLIEQTSEPELVRTVPEPQGEALAWTLDGDLVSIPEKPFMFAQDINFYIRTNKAKAHSRP